MSDYDLSQPEFRRPTESELHALDTWYSLEEDLWGQIDILREKAGIETRAYYKLNPSIPPPAEGDGRLRAVFWGRNAPNSYPAYWRVTPPTRNLDSLPEWFRRGRFHSEKRKLHRALSSSRKEVETMDRFYSRRWKYADDYDLGWIIPPLLPAMEMLFQLYLEDTRFRYRWEQSWIERHRGRRKRKCDYKQCRNGMLLLLNFDHDHDRTLFELLIDDKPEQLGGSYMRFRYKAGLVRADQIRLFEIAVRRTGERYRAVMKSCLEFSGSSSSCPDDWSLFTDGYQVRESLDYVGNAAASLISFLVRLRSERVESLLLKYLQEEGCNETVASAVSEAEGIHQELSYYIENGGISTTGIAGKWTWEPGFDVPQSLKDCDLDYYCSERRAPHNI
ncbi:hypothetical protein BJ508DRAFT_419865, partial [Ascobolus immersus RN42]